MAEATKRYAVVTGANKGIGLGICKQLASNGIVVVLTARNENRGFEAVQKLKDSGLSDFVMFHQLDVADTASIAALAHFIKTQLGQLDILVNNAGVMGHKADGDAFRAAVSSNVEIAKINWQEIITETYELAEECLTVDYYGAKRMVEALIPVLQLSDSPRIVNVSSLMGKLTKVSNKWAIEVLSGDNISEERIEEVLSKFLEDFKEGSLNSKGWPSISAAYTLSKAAMNAYTRIISNKFPAFRINCVCPGYVRTDMNFNTGILSIEEGAQTPVRLALLPNDGPTGCFFVKNEVSSF